LKLHHIKSQYRNIWTWLSIGIVILILVPNATILVNFFTQKAESWDHIQSYILPDLLTNTGALLFFTGLLTIVMGTSLAWLVAAYDFPMRRFFKWGLILPLAIPPYIAGYTYNGILNYTGVIQTTLRNHWDIEVNQAFFDILNLPGAVGIFTLFLYPYVYTMTYSYLSQQSATLIENARLLGRSATEIYIRIIIPISRGAIVGGVSLVLLEVLNDYGVVKYFGILFAIVIGNFARMHQGIMARSFARVTILGYSIPGAVIAVGISTVFIQLDKTLFDVYEALGINASLHLSTSLFMLISAYVIRFLAIGYNSIEAGFDKIGTTFTEASRTLGMNITKSFFKVDLPMMKGPLISGFMLAFIEILKELPLTLILRPFNFDTLSTKAFQYASDEQIHEAALPSLVIILVSGLAIYFFYHVLEKEPK